MRGRSSVVEHSCSERSVVGSIPIVRSISQSKRILMSFRRFPSLFVMMTTTICDTSGMIPVGGLDLASVCDDDLIPGTKASDLLKEAITECQREAFAIASAELDFDGTLRSRSEEHTSELQSLMRISYAVFCLTKQH